MMMQKILFVLLTVTLFASCSKDEEKPARRGPMNVTKSVTVEAIAPVRQDFVVRGDYPGEFVSDGMAELSSEVAGSVREVNVRLGDVVEEGDTLAVVDPVTYASRVKELRASVHLSEASAEEANVNLANLRAELDRKKPLLDQKLVTEREIEDLESRVRAAEQRREIARATVQQNQARLGAARDSLSDTRVKAPFDGTIAERYVDVGAHVAPGQPMFRVVDDQEIYMRLRVPETESGLVETGMPVEIRVDALGGRKVSGEVGRVAPAVDPATRTLRVDVVKPDDAEWARVKPGMYARAGLELGNRPGAITLDNQAILKGNDGSRYVWVVRDGKAEKQTITTGLRGRSETEVVEGLDGSEKVVLRGIEKLRPGIEVTLVKTELSEDDTAAEGSQ
jgi:RND family efflux transporter MFP subunit